METKKAIFNFQRFLILQAKLHRETQDSISDAYAFAWCCKLFPFLDHSDLHNALEDSFIISKEVADSICKYADEEWRAGRYHSFQDYEIHFNVDNHIYKNIDRHGLICVFRYMFLNNAFDKEFWKALIPVSKYPPEVEAIVKKLNIKELDLI